MSDALIRRARARREELAHERARSAVLEQEVRMWRNLALLLPYGVPVRPRRRLQLPTQRRPSPLESRPTRRHVL